MNQSDVTQAENLQTLAGASGDSIQTEPQAVDYMGNDKSIGFSPNQGHKFPTKFTGGSNINKTIDEVKEVSIFDEKINLEEQNIQYIKWFAEINEICGAEEDDPAVESVKDNIKELKIKIHEMCGETMKGYCEELKEENKELEEEIKKLKQELNACKLLKR